MDENYHLYSSDFFGYFAGISDTYTNMQDGGLHQTSTRPRNVSIARSNRIGIEMPPSSPTSPIDERRIADEESVKPDKKEQKPKPKPPKPKTTAARRWWVCFTWSTTWWIPSSLLHHIGRMKSPDVRMAWREKVALNIIILFLCALMIFFVQFFSKLLCPNAHIFSPQEVARHSVLGNQHVFSSWNGYVYDINSYIDRHKDPQQTIMTVAGKDASEWFPRIDPDTGALQEGCPPISQEDFQFYRPSGPSNATCLKAGYKTGYCHNPANLTLNIDVFHNYDSFPIYRVGQLAFPRNTIYDHSTPNDAWVLIYGRFYNVTELTKENSWLAPYFGDLPKYLNYYRGKDASVIYDQLSVYMKCLENQFFVGVVDDRVSAIACHASEYILLGCTGIMVAILVIKFIAALQLGSKRQPEHHDRFVIMQVPCYTEGEESLRKTIDSMSLLDYDDTRKLLFIVADGIVKGAGNDLPTPDIVLKILGVDTRVQHPEPKDYIAIGEGSKGHNRAKIYSGLYHIHARAVPFIVVVKCGKESETSKPGNRGKRDSQMILMKFLNKVHYQAPMTPLDLEMYHHIKNIIGVNPYLYEYVLMVDADTEVLPDSLNRLISCAIHDGKIMGICGETKIANEKKSWVTMMQVYEYYISHHMAKAFESLFGSVTCLPGCFSMYRVRSPDKKVPLLISSDIIKEYEENRVDTLHKKNLLSLGEDRFLTTLMLKYFPDYRTKFTPDARCLTIVPDQMSILLSQRRRWINSTIHNLFELLFLPQLCGCMIFSMRFVVFLDLFATLIMPATTGYLGYLIYAAIAAREAPILSLIMLAAAYGLQAVIFIIKREYQHVGWMIINILAMPVFSFWLPLYSFWHFDDFSWGNTRKIAGATGKDSHAGDGEIFDPSVIPLMTWEEYEETVLAKNHMADGHDGMDGGSEYGHSEYGPSEYGHPASVAPGPGRPGSRLNGRPASAYELSANAPNGPVRRRASLRSSYSNYSEQPQNDNRRSVMPPAQNSRPASQYGPASQYAPSNYDGPSHYAGSNYGPSSQYGPPSQYARSQYAPSHYAGSEAGEYRRDLSSSHNPLSRLQDIRASGQFRSDMALDRLVHDPPHPNVPDDMAVDTPWPGGFPTDEDIVDRIRYIIANADLHSLTKRKVKMELEKYFGVDLAEKRVFIGEKVEAIVMGRA